MYVDNNLLYSEDQAITGDAASTNVVNHANIGVGRGEGMHLVLQVTEAFNTLTSLTVSLQTDALATFGSAATVFSKVIALASLTLGAQFDLGEVAIGTPATELFSRMYYDVTGTDPTAGKLNAFWTKDVQSLKAPASVGITGGYPTY